MLGSVVHPWRTITFGGGQFATALAGAEALLVAGFTGGGGGVLPEAAGVLLQSGGRTLFLWRGRFAGVVDDLPVDVFAGVVAAGAVWDGVCGFWAAVESEVCVAGAAGVAV